jgi:hypothetical protein
LHQDEAHDPGFTTAAQMVGLTRSARPAAPAKAGSAKAQAPIRPTAPETLHGLSPAVTKSALAHFGSVAAFEDALRVGDVEALCQVDGIGERRAIELVQAARGIDPASPLVATAPAQKVLDDLRARILTYASTKTGRNRVRLLGFLPDATACESAARSVMTHRDLAERLDREAVRRHLRHVRPFALPPPTMMPSRAVLCEDDELVDAVRALGVARWCSVMGPRDEESAAEHELVVAVEERGMDTDGMTCVVNTRLQDGLAGIVPEAVLKRMEHNRATLEALSALAITLSRADPAAAALAILAQTAPSATPIDFKLHAKAVHQEMHAWVNERAKDVQVNALDLLKANGKMPAAMKAVLDAALQEARRRMHERTGTMIQAFQATLPLELDDDEVKRVQEDRDARSREDSFLFDQRRALELDALQPRLDAEVQAVLAFDGDFALGSFAAELDLRPARFGPTFRFEHGLHLDVPREGAQRVHYEVGGENRIALLTGANSGGKTTLLELMAQAMLLARLGLPVPAVDAEVPWVEELHYVTARRSLDAGAFEGFLRGFLPIALGETSRLVLADEVESVTELEAASRILGFALDRLAATQTLAVLVSHMAPQILAQTTAKVRVDGIEATGLDSDNRLVVDRQPRFGHLARSTPELIVQRLATVTKGPHQALYQDLLAAMQAPLKGPRGAGKAGK